MFDFFVSHNKWPNMSIIQIFLLHAAMVVSTAVRTGLGRNKVVTHIREDGEACGARRLQLSIIFTAVRTALRRVSTSTVQQQQYSSITCVLSIVGDIEHPHFVYTKEYCYAQKSIAYRVRIASPKKTAAHYSYDSTIIEPAQCNSSRSVTYDIYHTGIYS